MPKTKKLAPKRSSPDVSSSNGLSPAGSIVNSSSPNLRGLVENRKTECQTLPRNGDETPVLSRGGGKKRDHDGDVKEEEFGSEMKKLLESFEADITKTMASKRKRLETFTQNKMKNSNKKVEEIWKVQQGERQKLYDEYCYQVNNILQQWENDLGKSKEQEDKFLIIFRQQQKLIQQNLIIQQQRMKTLRDLQDHFNKGLKDLEKCHQDQQTYVQSELRKEMALLQKKILMDTQQQEMANVRKSLQSMLY